VPKIQIIPLRINEYGAINTPDSHDHLIAQQYVSLPIPIGISSSDMAARSAWINWYALGEEAEEDAAGLNYDYEFVVIDPGSHSITHVCSFSVMIVSS
jgi:hypothetical protein